MMEALRRLREDVDFEILFISSWNVSVYGINHESIRFGSVFMWNSAYCHFPAPKAVQIPGRKFGTAPFGIWKTCPFPANPLPPLACWLSANAHSSTVAANESVESVSIAFGIVSDSESTLFNREPSPLESKLVPVEPEQGWRLFWFVVIV